MKTKKLLNPFNKIQLRVSYKLFKKRIHLTDNDEINRFFRSVWKPEELLKLKQLYIAYLDDNEDVISISSINNSSAFTNELKLKNIILSTLSIEAAGIVVAQNYPEDSSHSLRNEEYEFHSQLTSVCDILGIYLKENIILSKTRTFLLGSNFRLSPETPLATYFSCIEIKEPE